VLPSTVLTVVFYTVQLTPSLLCWPLQVGKAHGGRRPGAWEKALQGWIRHMQCFGRMPQDSGCNWSMGRSPLLGGATLCSASLAGLLRPEDSEGCGRVSLCYCTALCLYLYSHEMMKCHSTVQYYTVQCCDGERRRALLLYSRRNHTEQTCLYSTVLYAMRPFGNT